MNWGLFLKIVLVATLSVCSFHLVWWAVVGTLSTGLWASLFGSVITTIYLIKSNEN